MNHQRPFQSQSFEKTGEHNSPKLYPFVPERASISRHKNRLQDQDHSCTLILLASLKNFSILCARAFARSRKRVVVGKQRCVPLTTLQFCTGIAPWTDIQGVKITRHRGAYIAVSSFWAFVRVFHGCWHPVPPMSGSWVRKKWVPVITFIIFCETVTDCLYAEYTCVGAHSGRSHR